MEPIKIVIDGARFSTIDGFYDEMERLLTKALDWKPGHNLDAFNDLLRGGFGIHGYGQPVAIRWVNWEKSRRDLGYPETQRYWTRALERCHPSNRDWVREQAEAACRGEGETLFDIIKGIILDTDDSGHSCTLSLEEGKEHEMKHSIAVDGPSGAGKSTLAKRLAEALGYVYVDTGAIYRTVGLFVKRRGVDPKDGAAVAALLPEIGVEMTYGEDGLQHMLLNGENVTAAIREHEISAYASHVSAIPAVRAFLLEMQRRTARIHSVVMDGRDIGTMVLPDADVKIYLTAAAETRAERRYRELLARGQAADYEQVLADVIARDEDDMSREISPLRQAEDAVVVDTTRLSFEESFQRLLTVTEERLA